MTDAKVNRCAVYTRKSTEEGLDQAFNSLDAQREACVAYISSQKHEGWKVTPTPYDDGGYSGGNIERPGMQRLLADVDAGLIDVVVVYKIDRLTRSLADFAKIVERFENRAVSFVSVTQSFNTTTSMGRLTLNVLLSFAQFEREVTAERIRDKFAASKAKGIFMGGCPPLGYEARDRKLIANESEVETVRLIFDRYLALGSIGKLAAELNARGITSKSWISTKGRKMGGYKWTVGALRHLLRNRVYVGVTVHKGKAYAGEHAAILPQKTFDAVQAALDSNRIERAEKTARESPGMLVGLIFDERGNAMTPQESRKPSGLRHTYYVSHAYLQHRKSDAGTYPRVPARAIEGLVVDRLRRLIGDGAIDIALSDKSTKGLRQTFRKYVSRIVVSKTLVAITFPLKSANASAELPERTIDAFERELKPNEKLDRTSKAVTLSITMNLKTYGGEKRVEGWDKVRWNSHAPRLNAKLIQALGHAHRWRAAVEHNEVASLDELAERDDIDRKQLRQTLRLAFLAPDIQRAILNGQQPDNLSLTALLDSDLPVSWTEQRQRLGLAP